MRRGGQAVCLSLSGSSGGLLCNRLAGGDGKPACPQRSGRKSERERVTLVRAFGRITIIKA